MAPSRRPFLRTLGVAGTAGLAGCRTLLGRDRAEADRSEADENWPMSGFDARNSGAHPDATGPTTDATVEWTFDTGGSGVLVEPAVVDGTVYAANDGGTVYAVAADVGEEVWRFEIASGVPVDVDRSAPALRDGTLYIGTDRGGLYAIEAASGEERWHVTPGTIPWRTFPTPATSWRSPTVVDDTVYVGAQEPDAVFALAADSGEVQWQSDVGDGGVNGAPAVANGTVYVGTSDGNVYALDAAAGEHAWTFETAADSTTAPAVVDGTVYVGSDDGRQGIASHVYAVDAATGEEQWRFGPIDGVSASPAVSDGTVYVGSRDHDAYAVDAATGEEAWRFDAGDWIMDAPAVVDGTVYVAVEGNGVFGVDAASGEQVWSPDAPDSPRTSPVVVNGTVYVVEDFSVVALTETRWGF